VGAQPLTLGNVEALAAAQLDPDWLEYFAGGAGDERTLRDNLSAFRSWRLRQQILCGIESVSTATTVLGQNVSTPIVVAPVGYLRMAHADGEEGMARAAAACGAAICLSTFAMASTADVAQAAPGGTRFLQLYVFRDRGITDELIAQALDAGYTALFLTVDLPVLGSRDRERQIAWTFPEESIPAVRYALGRGVAGEGLSMLDPTLDWSYLERLSGSVPVPVVVKGVLDPEDAVRAADHGAAGIVVSNHGGRQLDGALPTIEALPRIVEAVGDRLEVLLDGGIRRGTDVATALALGARAVLAGRLPLWGLAAGGAEGARTVLELLSAELGVALHLTGCRSVDELGPDSLAGRRGGPQA
jgi:isopentenyl diphosphate isomerase/L-lactate dehydrogenase-like FMN-dependent dehydrogenase